jgi:hypothetical protein
MVEVASGRMKVELWRLKFGLRLEDTCRYFLVFLFPVKNGGWGGCLDNGTLITDHDLNISVHLCPSVV